MSLLQKMRANLEKRKLAIDQIFNQKKLDILLKIVVKAKYRELRLFGAVSNNGRRTFIHNDSYCEHNLVGNASMFLKEISSTFGWGFKTKN